MTLQLGIVLALGSAIASNLAFFYKHRGARAAPAVDVRHPLQSARSLFRSRWFAVGMLVAVAAWLLHVGALALAPMSVVQVILASGVVLIAVTADRIFGFRVGRRQWAGLALTGCGLALLAVTLPTPPGAQSSYTLAAMVGFEGALFAVGALLLLGPQLGAPPQHHGAMLGIASGLLFGVSGVAIKALTGLLRADGWLGLVSPWLATAVAASVIAFYASARALQLATNPVPVIALTGTAANIAGIAGGILVFGDPLHGDAYGLAVQAMAIAMVIVAAALMPGPMRAARVST